MPPGAQVIDAAGAERVSRLHQRARDDRPGDPGAGGFDDVDEILDFNPQLRPQVAFHNDSDAIPVARANGVTTVAVTPGGGLLGGQVAVMNLDGWTWEESTVAPVGRRHVPVPAHRRRRTRGGAARRHPIAATMS